MQLVRYLFSYSIVVVVVVLIASGYYYRGTLFPNLFSHVGHMTTSETTAGKTNMGGMAGMGGMADKSMVVDQQMPGHAETAPASEASVTEPAASSESIVSAEPAATTEPVVPVEPTATSAPVPPLNQTEITDQRIQDAQMATGQAPRTEIATAPARQSSARQSSDSDSAPRSVQTEPRHMVTGAATTPSMPMHEQSAPVSPVPAIQKPRAETGSVPLPAQMQPEDIDRQDFETIMMARRAYWAGDFDASEQAYLQLIDRHPDEVELYGEVGNVYYAQGKWARAAAAYAQVVRQLYGTGQFAQAEYMLQIVTSLDKDLGKQLQRERGGTSGLQ